MSWTRGRVLWGPLGGPLWLAWKGVARGWSIDTGRGWIVNRLIQHANQFEFFPEDDGEPLKQGSDREVRFKVISQAAMNRLEEAEMK